VSQVAERRRSPAAGARVVAPLRIALYAAILAFGLTAPVLFPAYTFQVAVLWLMVMFALTWDIMGGQMGYNSLGNILFFGTGMYIGALVQIGLYYDIGEYTAAFGAIKVDYTAQQYFTGLILGIVAAAVGSALLAVIVGNAIFGLRGPYFAIGTLGIAFAAAELIGGWDWVGGGGGISLPVYPGEPDERAQVFYAFCFAMAGAAFLFVRWLYQRRFGLAINAIRDDEDKAEAMGIHTRRYKTVAWAISAFFLGIAGAVFGNMIGFIEPLEVAFPTVTFGIFMVAMSLLGGKGTLWGPVIGAVAFHVVKEVTWTYLLGWQFVALGLIIVVNIVFFQQGIMGWAREKWPHRFGIDAAGDDELAAPAPPRARAAE
jgi:branched-chain amino acid transport system permease protein